MPETNHYMLAYFFGYEKIAHRAALNHIDVQKNTQQPTFRFQNKLPHKSSRQYVISDQKEYIFTGKIIKNNPWKSSSDNGGEAFN